jgi:flagellar motor switch protein FliN
VHFRVEQAEGLAFGGMFVVPLAVSAVEPGSQILLYFDQELLDALSNNERMHTQGREADRSLHPRNLRLVMDVELDVSLRFGQRKLQLREVLELTSGSIVELDRMVDEPVELFLGDKLIARGEAVVVDGNYGLRVTEIPQPMSQFLN